MTPFPSQCPVPVVLLGGVSLVRTLGLAGIPAIVATSDPDEPALASRHCTQHHRIPRVDSGAPCLEALMALGARLSNEYGGRVPLMYGGDDALGLVNDHSARLSRYYRFLLNDREVGGALIAKDRFGTFARHRGLPVPRALAWKGDGRGTVRGTEGAVVAKPSEKFDWHHSALCTELFGGDGKALVFESGAAAAADAGVAAHYAELTFQEYIPGGHEELWSYHGFADDEGHVLAAFTGRKVRTYPAVTGESAFIELAENDGLAEVGRYVARRCPLKGFFKMDFKRDPRNGRWHLLEINARCTLWHYIGAANGVNLMRVAYDYLLTGERPEQRPAVQRYRWLSLELDFKAYREMSRKGELTAARWLGSILMSRNLYALFSWSDPGPWLFFWRRRIARRLHRGPARFASRLRQWRATAS